MALEQFGDSEDLYRARGADVLETRPLFTGDVFSDVTIPGIDGNNIAIIVGHPCTIRGARGLPAERISVAVVRPHQAAPPHRWSVGFFDRMPLPELQGDEFYAAHFIDSAPVASATLDPGKRVACLTEFGVNLLQQRMIWHLTRLEVPTARLHEAFSHTFEEADLLEEWLETFDLASTSLEEATAQFDDFIRTKAGDGEATFQDWLREPQRRSSVRNRMRAQRKARGEARQPVSQPPAG
jgi:hypothetical protein